jgi:predicted NBD/HSP70 family sugar kinase
MPGWHGSAFGSILGRRLGVPVIIENDANLMALGAWAGVPDSTRNLVVVKIGGGIGCGVITDGRLYRGASGVAGDISHNRVADAADRPCSCGNTGCLETIASGAALVKDLASAGVPVSSVADILSLVQRGDATATTALRTAGRQIGEVLATMVNFVDPDALLLAGHLSVAEPLVAAVRSVIYERCLPVVTGSLTISAVLDRDLVLRAAAGLVLQNIRVAAE